MKRASAVLGAAVAALVLGACGGSSADGGSSCTPGATATMTLAASGVSPKAVCVRPSGSVTFLNTDTVAHAVEFDAPCAALSVDSIDPSGSASVTFITAAICSFHDSSPNDMNTSFQGTVAVTSAPATGPGY